MAKKKKKKNYWQAIAHNNDLRAAHFSGDSEFSAHTTVVSGH